MPGFLLDTNVVSELMNPRADPNVLVWIAAQQLDDLHICTITIAELWRGVARLPRSRKRDQLAHWVIERLPASLARHVPSFDQASAMVWGELMGRGDRVGRPLPLLDAQIVAIAIRNELALATRNVADFIGVQVRLVDPWAPQ